MKFINFIITYDRFHQSDRRFKNSINVSEKQLSYNVKDYRIDISHFPITIILKKVLTDGGIDT